VLRTTTSCFFGRSRRRSPSVLDWAPRKERDQRTSVLSNVRVSHSRFNSLGLENLFPSRGSYALRSPTIFFSTAPVPLLGSGSWILQWMLQRNPT